MNDFPFNPDAKDWTPSNCYAMALMSELAYSAPQEIEQTCARFGFPLTHHFSSDATDTQGFIARRADAIVLAFRGTEPSKLRDWLVNVTFAQRLVPGLGNVHGGFRNSYQAVHQKLIDLLFGLGDRPLFITGHSRGGAEATLAAWRLTSPSNQLVQLYTFGSPRLMCKDAAEKFDHDFRGLSWRMVNNSDGVPRVPTRVSNHWHVASPITADADGIWCRGTGYWTKLLERVKGDWQEWIDGNDIALLNDHKISEYVRISKLNHERQRNP